MRTVTRRNSLTATAVAGALGLLGVLGTMMTADADTVPALAQHVAVPAYLSPGDGAGWSRLAGSGTQLGLVVANVASGPGTTLDAGWRSVIDTTHDRGVKVLGYVDTGYFGTTTPPRQTSTGATTAAAWLAQAEQDVDRWYQLYGAGVDGIFLDDAQNICGPTTGSEQYVDLYRQLDDYVHGTHPDGLTVANPGTGVQQCYADAADVLVTFEGSYTDYLDQDADVTQQWQRDADPDKFWHLVYDVPDQTALTAVLQRSKQNNAGYVYATPDTLPNPWDTVPADDYWNAELAGTG